MGASGAKVVLKNGSTDSYGKRRPFTLNTYKYRRLDSHAKRNYYYVRTLVLQFLRLRAKRGRASYTASNADSSS